MPPCEYMALYTYQANFFFARISPYIPSRQIALLSMCGAAEPVVAYYLLISGKTEEQVDTCSTLQCDRSAQGWIMFFRASYWNLASSALVTGRQG